MSKVNKKGEIEKITVFLLKSEIKNLSEVVARIDSFEEVRLRGLDNFEASLVVRQHGARLPAWTDLFTEHVDGTIPLENKNSSAILKLVVRKRVFLITFGYGHSSIDKDAIEDQFGLIVTLNSVHPDRIRALDRESFDAISRQSREQAIETASIVDFGIDTELDLIRAVVGKPEFGIEGKLITGLDSLHLIKNMKLSDIPKTLDKVLSNFYSDGYKKNFPWVDQISEVRSSREQERLLSKLEYNLKHNPDLCWLAIPQIIDWTSFSRFQFTQSKHAAHYSDINIDNFIREKRIKREDLSIALLQKNKVFCYSATSAQPIDQWPCMRCLYGEIKEGDDRFILSKGRWYRVNENFVDRIESYIRDNIPHNNTLLPAWDNKDHENTYNQKATKKLSKTGEYYCLDAKNIQIADSRSKIEFCDIFKYGEQLIHVKKYAGSSVLSHLFQQGVVSAELFLQEKEFRRKVREKLPEDLSGPGLEHPPDPRNFTVIYAIGSSVLGRLELPFFSKVTLKNAFDRLRAMNFKVEWTKIDIMSS